MRGRGQARAGRADGLVRLNKYLAGHGVASRRKCDELIEAGGVLLDGEVVTRLGVCVDPSVQRIEVDGVVLKPERLLKRYYLLNKPSGVVCTSDEREERRRAIDLVRDPRAGRLFTVGRLDADTVGLVVLTNDGEFANRLMHPRYGVPKTYRVKVQGHIDEESIARIRAGVHLSEGRTQPARVVVQRRGPRASTLLVTLKEGKNREVRRVFARMGYRVTGLRRIRIGPITDRGLRVGSWRPISQAEVASLLASSEGEEVPVMHRRRHQGRRGQRPARRPG